MVFQIPQIPFNYDYYSHWFLLILLFFIAIYLILLSKKVVVLFRPINKKVYIILAIIILIGASLRLLQPVHHQVHIDEYMYLDAAHTLLQTGQNGICAFRINGECQLYHISINLFGEFLFSSGLLMFGQGFLPGAFTILFMSILEILLMFLAMYALWKKEWLALLCAFFMAVNPYFIYMSSGTVLETFFVATLLCALISYAVLERWFQAETFILMALILCFMSFTKVPSLIVAIFFGALITIFYWKKIRALRMRFYHLILLAFVAGFLCLEAWKEALLVIAGYCGDNCFSLNITQNAIGLYRNMTLDFFFKNIRPLQIAVLIIMGIGLICLSFKYRIKAVIVILLFAFSTMIYISYSYKTEKNMFISFLFLLIFFSYGIYSLFGALRNKKIRTLVIFIAFVAFCTILFNNGYLLEQITKNTSPEIDDLNQATKQANHSCLMVTMSPAFYYHSSNKNWILYAYFNGYLSDPNNNSFREFLSNQECIIGYTYDIFVTREQIQENYPYIVNAYNLVLIKDFGNGIAMYSFVKK